MKTAAVVAAIVIQFAVLGWMAGQREWIVRTGPSVWLCTAPVDPRDPFRGDYVTLGYEISTIPAEKCGPALRAKMDEMNATRHWQQETVIFVALDARENGSAEIVSADLTPPESGLFIKGRVRGSGVHPSGLAGVSYGIDAFFVEQGRGRELEQVPKGTPEGMRVPLEMRAAFGSGGTAVLTGYRWGALGIGLKSASETNGTMEMILHNVSSAPVAVVLPEDQRTLRLRETPGMDVSEPRIPAPFTDGDVRVVAPGESVAVPVHVRPQWRERFEDKSWAAFQLVYTAPSAAECAALKDADKIWRGSLVSDRFAPKDTVVEE